MSEIMPYPPLPPIEHRNSSQWKGGRRRGVKLIIKYHRFDFEYRQPFLPSPTFQTVVTYSRNSVFLSAPKPSLANHGSSYLDASSLRALLGARARSRARMRGTSSLNDLFPIPIVAGTSNKALDLINWGLWRLFASSLAARTITVGGINLSSAWWLSDLARRAFFFDNPRPFIKLFLCTSCGEYCCCCCCCCWDLCLFTGLAGTWGDQIGGDRSTGDCIFLGGVRSGDSSFHPPWYIGNADTWLRILHRKSSSSLLQGVASGGGWCVGVTLWNGDQDFGSSGSWTAKLPPTTPSDGEPS